MPDNCKDPFARIDRVEIFYGEISVIMIIIVLVALSFFLPLIFIKRVDGMYLITALFLVVFYQILSFVNGYLYTFYPLTIDAKMFNKVAILMADLSNSSFSFFHSQGTNWFCGLLGYLYNFTPSIMVGQSVSVIAYSISTIVLYGFIQLFDIKKHSIPILIVFSLVPMHLFNRIGVMRESWELLFFMIALYYIIRFVDNKRALKYLLIAGVSFFCGAKLHRGIGYSAVFIIVMLLPEFIFYSRSRSLCKKYDYAYWHKISLYSAIVFFSCGFYFFLKSHHYLVGDEITKIQHSLLNLGNTSYTNSVGDGSILYSVTLFIKYMFYPLPTSVYNITGLLAMLMVWFRTVLLVFSFKSCFMTTQHAVTARKKKIILFSVLVVAFIFSQGTGTYGTALRHQILTFWGLVLLGMPGLYQCISTLSLGSERARVIRKKDYVFEGDKC